MRRDYVTLDLRDTDLDGDERPTAELTFDGPADVLEERLDDADDDRLDAERIDVAFRFQTASDADDPAGVLGLTNRVTGDFVLEVNTEAEPILDLVSAARRARTDDDEGRYRVVVRRDGEDVAVYEKRTLLVYDDEGSLLRQHSLIPSGVEL
jgi:hypothetical protein